VDCSTLAAKARTETEGSGMPRFIEREFRRYLECGILAHGFARVKCTACRNAYSFLVPSQYAYNYVSVTGAAGLLRLDGRDIQTMLQPFGTGVLRGARVPLQPGAHRIDCPASSGIEVYGWSHKVSYMSAGGLDLAPIAVR
jgi:hypothetical protein